MTQRRTRLAQEEIIRLILLSENSVIGDTRGYSLVEDDYSFSDPFDDEFRRYSGRLERSREVVVEIYAFWKSKRDLVIMKRVGMRLAACYASSANTERVFSGPSRICLPSRNP